MFVGEQAFGFILKDTFFFIRIKIHNVPQTPLREAVNSKPSLKLIFHNASYLPVIY